VPENATLVRQVRRLLDKHCAQVPPDQAHVTLEASRRFLCEGMIEQLLNLVEEFHQRPVRELEPTIRRMLIDQSFCDDNGDSVTDGLFERTFNAQVTLTVRVLERVRRQGLSQGRWSEMPAAQPMFG